MFLTNKKKFCAILLILNINVLADENHSNIGISLNNGKLKPINANGHAPIGVMGEHMHKKGEWMASYRFQHMSMEGNRIGTNEVTPEFIVTNVANRFAPPATLRVVPTKMTMDMHMFGAMYAPSNQLTLMFMTMYMEKSMDHITFQGGSGTTRRGTFTTTSSGIGDTKITGLFRISKSHTHMMCLNAGISLPTGDTDKRDTILTPTGARNNVVLPYGMQLGSGTFDMLPGVTYSAKKDKLSWGAQYLGTFRIGDNKGYSLGDIHEITSWFGYQPQPSISLSTRVAFKNEGKIDGIDERISLPVQTADPDKYGGDTINLYLGMNLAGQTGFLRGHRLALEAGIPIHQDLNGPQMETDYTITVGWQFAW